MSIPPASGPAALSAQQALELLRSGELSARAYAQALLDRTHEVDSDVQAWAALDEAFLMAQAEAADASWQAGQACGTLHGLPVGVKDIIDSAGLPTENGTVLHAGRRPATDALVVTRMRVAGAIVMGKTVTTELATYAPGKTRNPHDPAHTPGGSSSGSAAAVAAGMVPLAIGTQTNGSVIRPASFCGVVGYKPTAGWIARDGVLRQSPVLDQVGVFARTVQDAALLVDCLRADGAGAGLPLLEAASSGMPQPAMLCFVRPAGWERMEPHAQEALLALARGLGNRIVEVDLPPVAQEVIDMHRTIMEADIAASFQAEYRGGRERLSASLRSQIERGQATTPAQYQRALDHRTRAIEAFDALAGAFDALLAPATLGPAPAGLESTGDPVMCTPWTYTGQPAISLPLLRAPGGLPVGVQLVGRRGDDARLIRAARWTMAECNPSS
jgi:Asp-tRNA(Asn)/Glu-tRNA(Gln) amidotransferase A subunit family amidase